MPRERTPPTDLPAVMDASTAIALTLSEEARRKSAQASAAPAENEDAAALGRAMREAIHAANGDDEDEETADVWRARYNDLCNGVRLALGARSSQDPLDVVREIAAHSLEMRFRITALEATAQRERTEFRQELGALMSGVLRALGAAQHDDVIWAARQSSARRSEALNLAAAAEAQVRNLGAEAEGLRAEIASAPEACAAYLEAQAEERELSAGQTDDSVEHADLCQRAEHLRGAAGLLRRMKKGGA